MRSQEVAGSPRDFKTRGFTKSQDAPGNPQEVLEGSRGSQEAQELTGIPRRSQ